MTETPEECADKFLHFVRIEIGRKPTTYRVLAQSAHVVDVAHKVVATRETGPQAWIAYPRNHKLSRVAAVAAAWTPQEALAAATQLMLKLRR